MLSSLMCQRDLLLSPTKMIQSGWMTNLLLGRSRSLTQSITSSSLEVDNIFDAVDVKCFFDVSNCLFACKFIILSH